MAATNGYKLPTTHDIALQLPEVDPRMWKINDRDEETGLVLITPIYTNEGAREPPSIVRGSCWAMVDGVARNVVPTMGYLSEIETDSIEITKAGNTYITKVGNRVFEAGSMPTFEIASEGFNIRMFRFRGKDFFASHIRLDVTRSKWGTAHYIDALEHLPNFEDVFGDAESSSDVIYFNVTMPGNVTGSRRIFKDGGIDPTIFGVYNNGLGWTRSNPIKATAYDFADYPDTVKEALPLHFPVSLHVEGHVGHTITRVTDFLANGYYFQPEEEEQPKDPRFWTGESVIMRLDGVLYKLISPSFKWRNDIRNGDPSIYHRFNELITEPFMGWTSYNNRYLQFNIPSDKNLYRLIDMWDRPLVTLVPGEFSPETRAMYETDPMEYRKLIFTNYLFSLPPYQQKEALGFFSRYLHERSNLMNFLHAARKNILYLVDPRQLEVVGSTIKGVDPELPESVRVQKGADNRLYDVSEIDVPKGMVLTLLPELHHHVLKALSTTKYYVENVKGVSSRDIRTYNRLTNKSFHHHLDKLKPNHYHQLTKQATAWSRYKVNDSTTF